MITKTILVGLVVISVIAGSALLTPVLAETLGFIPIQKGATFLTDDKVKSVIMKLSDKAPRHGQNGPWGVGLLATEDGAPGTLLVFTTHKGVYDSQAQKHPDNPRRGAPNVVVDICVLNPDINLNKFCNAKWHTHMVVLKPTTVAGCGLNDAVGLPPLEVDLITWQEPSKKEFAIWKTLSMFGVSRDANTYINSLSGDPNDSTSFQLGSDIDGTLLQFDLDVQFEPAGVPHVCVENTEAVSGKLFNLG